MKVQKKRIKDLPVTLRPREKLLAKGAENLSDSELLAILLGTGTKQRNALSLAQFLFKSISLRELANVSPDQLEKIGGVGKGKAARIIAAIELGKRLFASSSLVKVIVQTTADALLQVKDIAAKKQEHLVVLYLNARHELLQKETVGMGSLNAMVIEPKEIFSPAVLMPCATIIIAHNHPSGDPNPSEEDIRFTKRIQAAGELMGIPLLDHLIVSHSDYFSFREE